ncbi:MAG: DHH family phosphoesterase [Candidatus Cloacimonadaceae bacterium]
MKPVWDIKTEVDTPLLSQIMSARGIKEEDLYHTLDELPDEALLANIETVAERIREALYKNEPLVIFGHDDPDGITSTYILYRYLDSIGYQKHNYFIPNRIIEHHGIQKSFIDFVREHKFPLVITVDNGISAFEGVEELNRMGCDVVVTDHHLVQPEHIPNAYSILNPQLAECQYPYKMLSGVGVVLMLIRYLSKLLEHPVEPALYFWAAIGSIADKVPMTGVNRILVRHVLNDWDNLKDSTIEFLQRNFNRVSGLTDKLNFMHYCSRLIANGREEDGKHIAMRFLLQLSDEKVRLFQLLEEEKNAWELALNNVFKLVGTLLEDFEGEAFIYYDDEDLIPYTLLGTAATYVVNNLGIPALFIKKRRDVMVCEGRCAHNFNMVESFNYCKNSLIQYGGHAKAAGFTMLPESYNDFIEHFHDYLKQQLEADILVHKLEIDAVLSPEKLSNRAWFDLERLLPFGQENPEPIILVKDCTVKQLNERFSIDSCSPKIQETGKLNIVIQLKNPNLIKILDYTPAEGQTA